MEEVRDKVKEIKQSFRLMMDGAVAKSMRDKGVDYKLNWGATLPRLQEKAEELKAGFKIQDAGFSQYDLAIALWKEPVRECKILATMLMPKMPRAKYSAGPNFSATMARRLDSRIRTMQLKIPPKKEPTTAADKAFLPWPFWAIT